MNLQGAYIQAYGIYHLRCDNNNYHCYASGTKGWECDMCMTPTPRRPLQPLELL